MITINGLTTVNCGVMKQFKNSAVEILGPSISGHKEYMAVSYAKEGNLKVSMVYDGKTITIFRFKSYLELQHYWSTNISVDKALKSKKYRTMAEFTIDAYNYYRNKV